MKFGKRLELLLRFREQLVWVDGHNWCLVINLDHRTLPGFVAQRASELQCEWHGGISGNGCVKSASPVHHRMQESLRVEHPNQFVASVVDKKVAFSINAHYFRRS